MPHRPCRELGAKAGVSGGGGGDAGAGAGRSPAVGPPVGTVPACPPHSSRNRRRVWREGLSRSRRDGIAGRDQRRRIGAVRRHANLPPGVCPVPSARPPPGQHTGRCAPPQRGAHACPPPRNGAIPTLPRRAPPVPSARRGAGQGARAAVRSGGVCGGVVPGRLASPIS